MGGSGGAPTEAMVCEGTGWTASALVSTDPPSNAIDRDADRNQSRFSTGRPMTVGDWLQVDFGRTLTVDDVSIRWGASDYAGKLDVRLSDTPARSPERCDRGRRNWRRGDPEGGPALPG
jgi:hypothetical protein